MNIPKYDGNIHPDEWIKDLQKYDYFWEARYNLDYLNIAISLVDSTIKLPTGIDNYEKLCNALKEDVSFTVFKNTNKKMLQSLKYVPESGGGNTSTFISRFRKLCYNAEINDIEEQKEYLYKSLPLNHFDFISIEFYEKMENIDSTNKLIKEFEVFTEYLSKLIVSESIVALKHVATGKYLSSIENLYYANGSYSQLVFVENSKFGPNSLWKINFNTSKELATYTDTCFITLQHVKSKMFLGIKNYYNSTAGYCYYKSPSTNHTEVSCGGNENNWNFKSSKLEGFLKSDDIINLSMKKRYPDPNGQVEFLRSHDIQFTIGNDTFQEVICHNGRLGENDEWRVELIKQYNWTLV